jgi:hypothetical protein
MAIRPGAPYSVISRRNTQVKTARPPEQERGDFASGNQPPSRASVTLPKLKFMEGKPEKPVVSTQKPAMVIVRRRTKEGVGGQEPQDHSAGKPAPRNRR